MTKYAGVGPVEFRYQAHELTIEAQAERIAALGVEDGKLYAPSNDELVRMIENIADQLSAVASQLVDVRQRLDKLEAATVEMAVEHDWNAKLVRFAQGFD